MGYANQQNGGYDRLSVDGDVIFTERLRGLAYAEFKYKPEERSAVVRNMLIEARNSGSHQAGFLLGAIECGYIREAISTDEGLIINYDNIVGTLWKAEDGGFDEYAEYLRKLARINPESTHIDGL